MGGGVQRENMLVSVQFTCAKYNTVDNSLMSNYRLNIETKKTKTGGRPGMFQDRVQGGRPDRERGSQVTTRFHLILIYAISFFCQESQTVRI